MQGGFADEHVYSVDFLNGIRSSRLPNHVLKLEVDVLIMLLSNIDQLAELCNGTRLIVTHLRSHVIEVEITLNFHLTFKEGNFRWSFVLPLQSIRVNDRLSLKWGCFFQNLCLLIVNSTLKFLKLRVEKV
ncbi:hypothetical protein V2J09_013446 [Rumex salicifolius]